MQRQAHVRELTTGMSAAAFVCFAIVVALGGSCSSRSREQPPREVTPPVLEPAPQRALEPSWLRTFAASDETFAGAATLTTSGALVVAGAFSGELRAEDESGVGAFVARFGADGSEAWRLVLAADSTAFVTAVVAGAHDGVIVAGEFSRRLQVGATALTSRGGADLFLAYVDAKGTAVWVRQLGGPGDESIGALARANDGGVFLVGSLSSMSRDSMDDSDSDFGGTPLRSMPDIKSDVVAARYSSDGQHVWSRAFGGGGDDYGQDAAVDAAGRLIVAGTTRPELDERQFDAGGGPRPTSAGETVFVVALSDEGDHVWSTVLGESAALADSRLALSENGEIDVVANVQDRGNTGKSAPAFLLARLSRAGEVKRRQIFQTRCTRRPIFGQPPMTVVRVSCGSATIRGVAKKANGGVWLAGHLDAELLLESRTLAASGGAFVIGVAPSGATDHASIVSGDGTPRVGAVLSGSANWPIVIGTFAGEIRVGALSARARTSQEAFLLGY